MRGAPVNRLPGHFCLRADIWRMKKHRRLLLILAAVLAVLVVLAGVGLLLASRSVTSYGTAQTPDAYAPDVAKMVSSQQEIADSLQARFESQPKVYSEVQQNFDHQSTQSTSPLKQWLGSDSCPIGQVRYTDVLNLSVTVAAGQKLDAAALLEEIAADGTLASGKLTGTSVRFKAPNFRIEVASVSAGDRYTLRLTIPNLPDRADRASYACYSAAQVPLSSVRQLG